MFMGVKKTPVEICVVTVSCVFETCLKLPNKYRFETVTAVTGSY